MSRIATEITEKPIDHVMLHDILQLKDPLLNSIVESLNNEVKFRGLGGAVYAEALGIQLAVHLLRNYANLQFKDISFSRLSKPQEKLITEYIHSNLHKTMKIEDLANQVGMGVWNFSKRFKESFHCSPHLYLTKVRAEKAKTLICEGKFAIKEIAYLCGFSDQSHLTRTLSKHFGITPSKLRKQ